MSKDNIYREEETLEARTARLRAEREARDNSSPSREKPTSAPTRTTSYAHSVRPKRVIPRGEGPESRDDDDRPIMDRSGHFGARDKWGFER